MNDDEINEIIARSDEEAILYKQMDDQRDRDAMENWRRAGNRGKPPPPLMQLEELPEFYRSDEPFTNENELDELEGRGHRRRTVVNYNDGLSDDQWAIVRVPNFQSMPPSLNDYFRHLKRAKTCKSCRHVLWRRRSVAFRASLSRKLSRLRLNLTHPATARARRASPRRQNSIL